MISKHIYKTLLLTLLITTSSNIKSEVREINSIQDILKIFDKATLNDLFVFDFDNTLLESTDLTQQTRFHKTPEIQQLKQSSIILCKSKQELDAYRSSRQQREKYQPVEQAFIDNIKKIQDKKCKTMVLTKRKPGPFGDIKQIEDWLYTQLLNVGLDFNISFNTSAAYYNTQLNTFLTQQYKETFGKNWTPPVFYKGILCSNLIAKGTLLKRFILITGWRPQRIFFFDDQTTNAFSVADEMETIGIECHAFIYKAATSPDRAKSDWNIEITRLQYELIKQRKEYVDYFEAQELFKNHAIMDTKKEQVSTSAA